MKDSVNIVLGHITSLAVLGYARFKKYFWERNYFADGKAVTRGAADTG